MHDRVHLVRDLERVAETDALADVLGGRCGLDAVLADLDRTAIRGPVPGRAVSWGFALDARDNMSGRWWPQGISSSADAADDELYAGRRVVVTSSYSKKVRGFSMGSRLTFFDVTDTGRVRYGHVLLVEPVVRHGDVTCRPLRIHAGGLVWRGPWLHVAGTARGIYSFRLSDIVRVGDESREDRLGALPDGSFAGFGHRYLLPLRLRYGAVTEEGHETIRYSFVSLDRDPQPHVLAGEYGREGQTTRLVRFGLTPDGLLVGDEQGVSRPVSVHDEGIRQMQGAVSVAGRLYVTQSHGRFSRGSLWTGTPGAMVELSHALPPGPEDVCHWPSTDQLWSVTEHPMLRFVVAVDRPR